MGDNANVMLQNLLGAISFDSLLAPIEELTNNIPADLISFFETYKTLCLFAYICLLALLAFEGYKLFKMGVYAAGAFVFGFVGYSYIYPLLADTLSGKLPEIIDPAVLVAVVFALVAIFLTRFAYDFMILALGGVTGYFLGSMVVYNLLVGYFTTLDFLKSDIVKYIVGGIFAAILGIVFILLFKHIFMVGTSFICMMEAALSLQVILLPEADITIKLSFLVLGIVLGIFAVVYQYKQEEKAQEIVI